MSKELNGRIAITPRNINAIKASPKATSPVTPRIEKLEKLEKPEKPEKLEKIEKPTKQSPVHLIKTVSIQPIAPQIQPKKYPEYTNEEINEMLSEGYIIVHRQLWDYIPSGSHIRYYKKSTTEDRRKMFRPGGFVQSRAETPDGKKIFMLESKLGGKRGDPGYITFPIAYDDIDEIWKKYSRDAFIETHLIYGSLAQKKKQIEDLISRIEKLERIITQLKKF